MPARPSKTSPPARPKTSTGVMTAMEKSDLAFKTLLAIRSKLMDAYDEIKGISDLAQTSGVSIVAG